MSNKPIHILLVEDNPADARLIKEDLDSSKYTLEVADRLATASTYLRLQTPDIILADLTLPDSEFTNTIAELHSLVPNIPIIALTGISDKNIALEAVKVGAQDFLVKGGFEAATLEQRILYAIERKRTEESQARQRFEIVQQVISSAKQDVQRSDPRNIFFRCVEDCNEGIMILDNLRRLLYVNPAWEKIYGYLSSEIVGRTLHFLQAEEENIQNGPPWARANDLTTRYWRGEVIHRSKDGRPIPVLLTIAPSLSTAGDSVGYMGIALDMTTQKELETRIYQQEHLVSIGILASGLAHEIGTPLGIIRGHAEFLQPSAPEKGVIREGLEVIVNQIDRISKLVSSLLQLSRGSSDVSYGPVALSPIFHEVVTLLEGNFKKFGISFSMEVPEDLEVISNSHRLQQILINLMINSIHAIEEAIKKGRGTPHKISIEALRKDDKVLIRISDSGTGIPAANQKKLFQPFFTTKDIGKGTGLGLAVVYNLVNEMGGEILVDSAINKYTTFTVVLRAP